MMVLDTHALIWWANGDHHLLSSPAREALDQGQASGLLVSAISAWEMSMLVNHGRLHLAMDVGEWFGQLAQLSFIQVAPVDVSIAIASTQLPAPFHKDPADRMIVATARKHGFPLISADEKIRAYPHVNVIW